MTDGPQGQSEPLSPAALRMRLYRDRRRKKLRCLTIELRETEIETLVHRGLLSKEMRNDLIAIRVAFYDFLDQTLN
jgi:hypothetical protein